MATHDPNLRPGASRQLPGIFQGAVTAVLAGGCLWAINSYWEPWFGDKLPETKQLIVANAIVAFVVVPAIWLILELARSLWSRRHTGSPKARGDRLAIYVARIDGDDARGTARSRIIYSLHHEIGADTVEVLPAGLRPRWHGDLGFDAIKIATERKAHRLLRRKGGHLLIWGRLDHLDGRSMVELNFTSPESVAAEGRYGFTDKLLLDAAFGSEAGAALAATAAALAVPAADHSRFIADRLRPLTDRLHPLAQRPPVALCPDDRARIYFGYALLRHTIGKQSGQSDQLVEAIAFYREALKEWTRERAPFDWAMTQNNLGAALQALGERENDITRLVKAVAAYREALKEWTRERVPLGWAMIQNNLGNALLRLGERESGTAHLKEAVAAYRKALKERTCERVPLDWPATQNNLGSALQSLGRRESGTAHFKEAAAAYRKALKKWTRKRAPFDWARAQNNLGNALESLGERENNIDYIKEAIAAFRDALKERTRKRVPLDWAATQNNLGVALQALGERESGTARLEEAVVAYDAALEVFVGEQADHPVEGIQRNRARAVELLQQRRKGAA